VSPVPTAIVVPGHRTRTRCLQLVREAERVAEETGAEVVVFSGRARRGGASEAEQMRSEWRGGAPELVVEPTASTTVENASRTLPLLLERGVSRALVVCAPLHRRRARFVFTRLYRPHGIDVELRLAPVRPNAGALLWELAAGTVSRRQLRSARRELAQDPIPGDTLVFVPAWNEEESLPGVLADLEAELPGADVLVVDDGSTDRTAEVARERGAEVLSLDGNRGLPVAIAGGYRWALDHGYRFCGRVDADGQHPAAELSRLLALVRAGRCDVAVGSRFVAGDGYAPYRYRPAGARRLGTAVLRRAMRRVLGRPFADATSGLYAVNAKALPVLAEPFATGAPEVEALIRISDAGLRLEEVPVDMATRASGESKLRGRKAVELVLTVAGALVAAWWVRARRAR
jgi:hypothetical protein